MKKIFALLLAASLAGCATYREPMSFERTMGMSSELSMRYAIIKTAQQNHWGICDKGNNTLLVDMLHKKWKLFADVTYTDNSFTVTPNLELITLKNEEGQVHRSMNNLSKRMAAVIANNFMQLDFAEGEAPKIDTCKRFEPVEVIQGGVLFTGRRFSNVAFAWENESVRLPETTNFTYEVKPNKNVPTEVAMSLNERMQEALQARSLADTHQGEPYHIEIDFKDLASDSNGAVADFFIQTYKDLVMMATVYDPERKPVCYVYLSTRSEEGGWTGIIHKATNSVTRNAVYDLFNILEIKLFGREIELKR